MSPYLDFMPEVVVNSRISRLSHSGKWLEGFSPDLRVPMITSELGHFYVYEPVQIDSEDIVIPIFFFNQEGVQMARCLTDCMIWMEDSGTFESEFQRIQAFTHRSWCQFHPHVSDLDSLRS